MAASRIRQIFVILTLYAGLGSLTSRAADLDLHRPTTVLLGKHELLRLEKIRSAKVANASLAEVKVLGPTEVLVKGLAKGETTLTLGRAGEPDVVYPLSIVDRVTTAENEILVLGVGLQRTLPAEGVKRIAIGDPKIANVQTVSTKELLLTGVAAGRTSLIVWYGDEVRVSYAVKVLLKAIEEDLKEIKQLLGPMEGITLKVVGDKIYLDGEPETVEDANLAKNVCHLYEHVLRCL